MKMNLYSEIERVLFDTDFVIAFMFQHQSTHTKADKMYQQICDTDFYMLDIVASEMVTTISKKFSQKIAIDSLLQLKDVGVHFIQLSEKETESIWKEWSSYSKNGTSFFDCANLIMAKKLQYQIASFDKFYPATIRITD